MVRIAVSGDRKVPIDEGCKEVEPRDGGWVTREPPNVNEDRLPLIKIRGNLSLRRRRRKAKTYVARLVPRDKVDRGRKHSAKAEMDAHTAFGRGGRETECG